MNPDRWRQIEELCHAALERDERERAAFLDEACAGDADLRQQVESLLAEQARAESFLEAPVWQVAARALAPGTRLGPYEIQAAIGAGGMGAVYRARDTRLDRIVALKVLPPEVRQDPDRQARFEREAKAISHLTHPHICTLFDVGREGDIDFLVMEHLEGETLAGRLDRAGGAEARPLQLDEALRYAIEIADALDAAHRHGIVHRDLKPGNVMLTKTGAKLLDFGLAKLRPAAAALGATTAPTAGASGTVEGTLLGTLPYMAPEQLEAKAADARTDLWAFGCVLYEMVGGRRAFEGTSQASLVGAIMTAEPPPLSVRQPLTPPALDHVVRTCLAKDPDERWQSAADVKRELCWIADERRLAQAPGSGQPPEVAPGLTAVMRGQRLRHALGFAAVAVLLVATTAALTWMLAGRREPQSPSVQQFLIDAQPAEGLRGPHPSERVTGSNRPSRTAIALSPDGTWLVFSGVQGSRQQLYRRKLSESVAVPLEDTEGADNPFFSPDGTWIGFWARDALCKMRLEGGPRIELCRAAHIAGASWSAKDIIAFAPWGSGSFVHTVPAAGGAPKAVTTLDRAQGETQHALPHFLPDGDTLLFTAVKSTRESRTASTAALSLATGARRLLIDGAVDARYVPSGHLVYARLGRVYAVPFDPRRIAVTGGAVAVLPDVMQATNAQSDLIGTGAAQFTTARTGMLVYVAGGIVPDPPRELVWVDRRGTPGVLPLPPGPYATPRLSPDGARVLYVRMGLDRSLWCYDVVRQTSTIIPTGQLQPFGPMWTTDGQRAVFVALGGGPNRLHVVPVDGSAPPAPLAGDVPTSAWESTGSWTPDGKTLVFTRTTENEGEAIWRLDLRDGQPQRSLLLRPAVAAAGGVRVLRWPAVSPDGRWLAYVSNESGRNEVYIQGFPELGGRQKVSREGGRAPVWRRDGRELFYVTEDQLRRMMAIDFRPGAELSAGTPRVLFDLPAEFVTSAFPVAAYDVSKDGQRFLFVRGVRGAAPSPPSQMHVVLNWFEELKAKVPTRR